MSERGRRARRNGYIIGANGELIRAKLTRKKDHVTLWVEGAHNDEPAVAAAAVDVYALDQLISRLIHLRAELKQ